MKSINKKKLGKRPEAPSTVITIVINGKGEISHSVTRGGSEVEPSQVGFIMASGEGQTVFGTTQPVNLNFVRGIAREGERLVRKMDELAQDMIVGFLTEGDEEDEDDEGGEETPDSSDEDDEEEGEPEAPKPLAALDGCTVPGCPIAGGCGRKECPTKTA